MPEYQRLIYEGSLSTDHDWYCFLLYLGSLQGPFPIEVNIRGTETQFDFSNGQAVLTFAKGISLAKGFISHKPAINRMVSSAEVAEEMRQEWNLI